MITLGLIRGGLPETKIATLWGIAADECGDAEKWCGHVWGINIIFHEPGPAWPIKGIKHLDVGRFSKKEKLLLISAVIPRDIVNDTRRSKKFIVQTLRDAVAIAETVFAKKKMDGFSAKKALRIVDRIEKKFNRIVFKHTKA